MTIIHVTKDITLERHSFNKEKSLEVHTEFKGELFRHGCYINVYHVLTRYGKSKIEDLGWKVAYGYICYGDTMRIRHCFIVDNHEEAIDPTYFLNTHSHFSENPYYYVATTFSFGDYLQIVEEHDYKPALSHYFKKQQQTLMKWGMDQEPKEVFYGDN